MAEEKRLERILVHAPSWVGDLVMATAAFRDLRRTFPQSQITFLLKPGREKVVGSSEFYDRMICDRSSGSLTRVMRLARGLRGERFDLALLFPDSLRSRLLARLARIPRRVGYARDLGALLLTERVGYPHGVKQPEPMPLRFQRLLEAIGVAQADLRPQLDVSPREEEEASEIRRELGIGSEEGLVGLNPGASFGASKIWPPSYFARLGDAIAARHGVRSILLVGPGEESIAGAIEREMQHRPISTVAKPIPLDALKPIIRDLRLLVTTDTGPRHYAVAFRRPVVVLMGPTDRRYTDIHLDETVVIQRDLPCVPCHLKVCPIDHRCMRGISVEEVMEHVEELDRRLGVF